MIVLEQTLRARFPIQSRGGECFNVYFGCIGCNARREPDEFSDVPAIADGQNLTTVKIASLPGSTSTDPYSDGVLGAETGGTGNCDSPGLSDSGGVGFPGRSRFPREDATDCACPGEILEHFTRDEGEQLLRECRRVLEPAGVP